MIPSSILSVKPHSVDELLILSLAVSFKENGLRMSNLEIAKVLHSHEKSIARDIGRLVRKKAIKIIRDNGKRVIVTDMLPSTDLLPVTTVLPDSNSSVTPTVTPLLPNSNTPVTHNIKLQVTSDNITPPTPQKGTLFEDAQPIKHKRTKPGFNGYTKDFERFWAFYPRPVSKGDAFKAWKELNPDDKLVEYIVDHLKRRVRGPEWMARPIEKIPYPATWIRARGWEDNFDLAKEDRYDTSRI